MMYLHKTSPSLRLSRGCLQVSLNKNQIFIGRVKFYRRLCLLNTRFFAVPSVCILALQTIFVFIMYISRSQRPRGLRRRSPAPRLPRLWVRIPPGHICLSVVSVVYCQVEVSATSWSLFQRNRTDCGASLCVIQKPHERGAHGPLGTVAPKRKKWFSNGNESEKLINYLMFEYQK